MQTLNGRYSAFRVFMPGGWHFVVRTPWCTRHWNYSKVLHDRAYYHEALRSDIPRER